MWPETRISGVLSGLFEILKRKNFFCWIGQATVTLLALAWLIILFLKSNHLWSLKLIIVSIFPLLKLSLNNCKLDLFFKKILSWGSVLYLKILTCMNSCLLCLNRCYVNVTWIYLRRSLVDLTAQKMKFSIKNLFSKRHQIRSFLTVFRHTVFYMQYNAVFDHGCTLGIPSN